MELSSSYTQISNSSNLERAGENWFVVIADIVGSTKAILNGRYKEVNLVGAACIAAIRNEFEPKDVMYVFGGDGATFLLPPDKLHRTIELLHDVKTVAHRDMGFNLRIGHICVAEVSAMGGSIYHGFLPISEHEGFSYFRGNGIDIAEREIKRRVDKAEALSRKKIRPLKASLKGLSCRLLPFKSQRGEILSLIIEPKCYGLDQDEILGEIFEELQAESDLSRINPVALTNYKRVISIKTCVSEAHLIKKGEGPQHFIPALLFSLFESVVSYILFAFNIPIPVLGSPAHYDKVLIRQSDWIKMDGCLRLVIDVNPEEKSSLLAVLERIQQEQKIAFGYYSSDAAVMVCHYQSGVDDRHIHFIDGAQGGLTRAAKMLKRQRVAA